MTSLRREFLRLAAAVVALPAMLRTARAKAYPARPTRLIVPFPASGVVDIFGRLIGQSLSGRLGQPVIIDNRPGAGGNLGTDAVVRAAPDGYTLLRGSFNRLLCAMVAVGVGLGLVAGRSASAESYPTRPITMVVPFPAGGPADLVGRLVAERMKRELGQPIIVENVGGANGAIGIAKALRASPDGYTIHIGIWGSHVINGAVNPLPFDPLKDIEPVSLLVSLPLLLFARKDLPPEGIRGLIAWLKANPGKATLGTSTAGTQAIGALFQQATGTQLRLVPYRGAAPALQDLAAGHIDLGWESSANLPQVRSGAIKAYLVTSKVRLKTDPSIPTAEEMGLGALTLGTWVALFATHGTPREIIDGLNRAAAAALDDPMIQKRFSDVALDIVPSEQRSPEFLGRLMRSEIERWWPIVKAANIRGD